MEIIRNRDFIHAKECFTRNFEGKLYTINYTEFDKLTEIQKILINEIIRFCENEEHFPKEKELTNKNGYVSRTRFYKYFNIKGVHEIYNIIMPIELGTRNKDIAKIQKQINKPEYYECSTCKEVKLFINENFSESKASKYKLNTQCRICENEYSIKLYYKKKGILFERYADISPEKWWEYQYNKKIKVLPEFCHSKENALKIVRYVFLEKFKLSKEEICNMTVEKYKMYKLFYIYTKFGSAISFLKACFPEMNISTMDLPMSKKPTDEEIVAYLDECIIEEQLTALDILDSKFKSKNYSKLDTLAFQKFRSYNSMFLWYFNKTNTLHPITNREITKFDFKMKPNNFWTNKENRIIAIKMYCESNGINKVINNNELLKKWVYEYFKQVDVSSIMNYANYYDNTYDVLIEAYPEILENKTLFFWEWHQCYKNDCDFYVNALREMLLYRENLCTPKEISSFLRYKNLIDKGYTKFIKQIDRGRFENLYQWANLSFPEHKNKWTVEDFGNFYAKDGAKCDSLDEVAIYEFIKFNLAIESITPIGTLFEGEHIFKLNEKEKDNWYCPDFVFYLNDKKYYIEYFGMYSLYSDGNKLLTNYKNKTYRKINFYNKTGENFIYLFPQDLKNNFEGMKEKLKNIH